MTRWTLAEVGRCLGATEAVSPAQGESVVSAISTDTRTLTPGSVFVPLVGERFDGHDFAKVAVEKGCAGIVWSRPTVPPELSSLVVFQVEDTLEAYQALGLFWKKRCGVRCVGITGSIGKTTTKEILAHLIGESLRVHKNRKNYNNDIGVPLTLLELQPEHDLVIVEMGMRGPGQIARLVGCAEPEVGIITAIGTSHLELLGSREAIALAKSELFQGLPGTGRAIVPATDDYFELLCGQSSAPLTSYAGKASEGVDLTPQEVLSADSEQTTFLFDGQQYTLPLPGPHHLHDLFAALAAGQALGLSLDELLSRVASLSHPEGRAEWKTIRGARFFLDAYNSAPESLRASLEVLATCTGRKLAVLGDMLELGSGAERAHQAVGNDLRHYGVAVAFCVGPLSKQIAEQASKAGVNATWFANKEELTKALLAEMQEGDSVLVKASRGLALETVVQSIEEKEAV